MAFPSLRGPEFESRADGSPTKPSRDGHPMSIDGPLDEQPVTPGRLRFEDLEIEDFPDSHCEATASLTPPSGLKVSRVVSGPTTLEGRLRAAAQATLDAAGAAAGEEIVLELAGAKAVRAFDASIVIVAIRATADGRRYRLTGCYASQPDDAPRGAALAALDAINRVLSPFLE